MEATPGLHVADYVVFGATLAVSLGIGVYYSLSGGKQKTTDEYLMGNRQMSTIPVCLSYTVSFISTILILGFPAEIYSFGSEIVVSSFGIALGNLLAVFIFVPILYPLKYTSVNEYLLRRYNSQLVKSIGSICTLCGAILYSSNVYFGPSTAIEAVTGFPAWISIIIGASVSVCYTTIGGFKAVVWTDVFQSLIMFLGMMALVVQGLITVGGFGQVFTINNEWGRLNFFNFDVQPSARVTLWNSSVNRILLFLNVCGVGQASFQRYCSMPTRKQANRVVIGSIPGMLLLGFLAYLMGWTAFAYYTLSGCDPLKSGKITNPNQVIPLFVMEVFSKMPGIPGLFLAACTAGSLSSASSALNAFSAIALEDIFKPLFPQTSKTKQATVAKIFVLAAGAMATGLGFSFITIGGTVLQIMGTFSSAFDGTFLSLFLIGVFFPWGNWKGVMCGSVVSSIFGIWVSVGSYMIKKHLEVLPTITDTCPVSNMTVLNSEYLTPTSESITLASLDDMSENIPGFPPWLHGLYSLSWMWILPCVLGINIVVSVLASLALGGIKDSKKVDNKTVHKFLSKYCRTDPLDGKPQLQHADKNDVHIDVVLSKKKKVPTATLR